MWFPALFTLTDDDDKKPHMESLVMNATYRGAIAMLIVFMTSCSATPHVEEASSTDISVSECAWINGLYRYEGMQVEVDGRASDGVVRLTQDIDPSMPSPSAADSVRVHFVVPGELTLEEYHDGFLLHLSKVGAPATLVSCSQGQVVRLQMRVTEYGEIVNRTGLKQLVISRSADGGLTIRQEYRQLGWLRTHPSSVIVTHFSRIGE